MLAGVAPPTIHIPHTTSHLLPHTSSDFVAFAPSQIRSPIVMHLFLRHTRPLSTFSFVPNLPAMSHFCAAIASASNSAAVSTIDAEARAGSKARIRGVVFDMDGTLTVPVINFQAMYKAVLGEDLYAEVRLKNPSGIDILHQIEGWSPGKQKKAFEVIAQFEKDGINRLQIMPGATELCHFLDSKKIRRGLITRNVKDAVDVFHKHFGSTFSPALSREFHPYKPNPAPLLHICAAWKIEPHEVVMIGDSLKDDVACGKRAGAYTMLLDETGRYNDPAYSSFEYKPDFKVSSLIQALSLLEMNFHLAP
ncbi:hypothetical protein V2J09_014313 [Rumex salicifolius]